MDGAGTAGLATDGGPAGDKWGASRCGIRHARKDQCGASIFPLAPPPRKRRRGICCRDVMAIAPLAATAVKAAAFPR